MGENIQNLRLLLDDGAVQIYPYQVEELEKWLNCIGLSYYTIPMGEVTRIELAIEEELS